MLNWCFFPVVQYFWFDLSHFPPAGVTTDVFLLENPDGYWTFRRSGLDQRTKRVQTKAPPPTPLYSNRLLLPDSPSPKIFESRFSFGNTASIAIGYLLDLPLKNVESPYSLGRHAFNSVAPLGYFHLTQFLTWTSFNTAQRCY